MPDRPGRDQEPPFAEPFDPYAPPGTTITPARPRVNARRLGAVAVRVLAVVLGFSLIADPTSLPGVDTAPLQALGGHVFARGVGLILLAGGFLPWRGGRRRGNDPSDDGAAVEEL